MKAVIYARFSCDRQREESIEGQIRECTEYAQRQGITIVGEYIDRAKSAAKDVDKRENFLRMVRDSSRNFLKLFLSGSWIALPGAAMIVPIIRIC